MSREPVVARRVTVQVQGGSFVETLPFLEVQQLGLAVGSPVDAQVLPDDRTFGRIRRPAEPARGPVLGVAVAAFIAVLGAAAAFVA